MGLQEQIGYTWRRANVAQRALQRMGSTRPGSWVFARVLPPVDRVLHRRSGGRLTVPGVLAGLPVIMLTTTGARTGRPRPSPLAAVPVADDLAVIGTNFAQRTTPGWVVNLEAHPHAELRWRDRTVPVVARPAEGDERDRIWATARSIYHGFATYPDRIHGRAVRVFVLEPADLS
ncbi:MAG TPA: nitroreductase family deazaflavin-dependent oxidoreductase [Acidimicrobiales bacterium]|nr:nitroreductase family deazaflavin-dependent oxidoreductase [Acidimicrobiales bacterium]